MGPKRVCETKTHEYKVVTGHEKGDCKEIEVCKPLHHRRRRSPHGFLDHPYHECETEKKEGCKVVPTVEEKSDEVDVCHIEPEKVCEEKEIEVAKCPGATEKRPVFVDRSPTELPCKHLPASTL